MIPLTISCPVEIYENICKRALECHITRSKLLIDAYMKMRYVVELEYRPMYRALKAREYSREIHDFQKLIVKDGWYPKMNIDKKMPQEMRENLIIGNIAREDLLKYYYDYFKFIKRIFKIAEVKNVEKQQADDTPSWY